MLNLTEVRQRVADIIAPELKEQRNNLERLANFDPVTELPNRRAFNLAIDAAEDDPTTAIVLFDANNFGKLNKAAGHRFGDIILRDMAETIYRIAGQFGVAARVFRFGGDEFVVLCPAAIADRLRDNCEAAFGVRFPGLDVSLVGTAGETLAIADETLQARKRARKAK